MTDYNYTDGKFSSKDSLPPDDALKYIVGQDFEDEFVPIETAVNSKLNESNPAFIGTMTSAAGNITIGGTLQANLIEGGTY